MTPARSRREGRVRCRGCATRDALLDEVGFAPGTGSFKDIYYCLWCHYSREWIAEHGHDDKCQRPVSRDRAARRRGRGK